MFFYDAEQEGLRLIAKEHRVPLDADEIKYRNETMARAAAKGEQVPYLPDDKHDGTFDVLHCETLTGKTKEINLTHEELADVLYLGMRGDEDLPEFYEKTSIKRYQELMKDARELSFIP